MTRASRLPQVLRRLEQSVDVSDGISPDAFVLMYLEVEENTAATQVQALLRGKARRQGRSRDISTDELLAVDPAAAVT